MFRSLLILFALAPYGLCGQSTLSAISVKLHDGSQFDGYYIEANPDFLKVVFPQHDFVYRIERKHIASFSYPASPQEPTAQEPIASPSPQAPVTASVASPPAHQPKLPPSERKLTDSQKARYQEHYNSAADLLKSISPVIFYQVHFDGVPLEYVRQQMEGAPQKTPEMKAFLDHPYFDLPAADPKQFLEGKQELKPLPPFTPKAVSGLHFSLDASLEDWEYDEQLHINGELVGVGTLQELGAENLSYRSILGYPATDAAKDAIIKRYTTWDNYCDPDNYFYFKYRVGRALTNTAHSMGPAWGSNKENLPWNGNYIYVAAPRDRVPRMKATLEMGVAPVVTTLVLHEVTLHRDNNKDYRVIAAQKFSSAQDIP